MRLSTISRIVGATMLLFAVILTTTTSSADVKFSAPAYFPASTEASRVRVADINRDGKLDLIVSGFNQSAGTCEIAVLLGQGDGSFAPSQTVTHNCQQFGLAVGDFNNDGRVDIQSSTGTSVLLFRGNGDGTFQAPVTSTLPLGIQDRVSIVADFNHDQLADLAFENFVLLGDGAGSFGFAQPVAANSTVAAVADFNGDGKPDLLLTVSGGYAISFGNGDGSFQAPSVFCSHCGLVGNVTAADFNNDGKVDIAGLVMEPATNPPRMHLGTMLGHGDGTFSMWTSEPGQWPWTVPSGSIATDFTGFGKKGLAAWDTFSTSNAFIASGDGDGTFTQGAELAPPGYWTNDIAVGDFNGDHAIDLAVAKGDFCGFGGDDSGKHCGVAIALNMRGTFVALNVSANPSAGKKFSLTASVKGSVDKLTMPGGTVIFTADGTILGSARLYSGKSVIHLSKIAPGAHQIVAYYLGDANFNPNWSDTLTQVVLAKPKK